MTNLHSIFNTKVHSKCTQVVNSRNTLIKLQSHTGTETDSTACPCMSVFNNPMKINNLMLFVHMKITPKTFSSSQTKMNSDMCCTELECPFTNCYLRFKHPKGRQHLIIEDHFEKQP